MGPAEWLMLAASALLLALAVAAPRWEGRWLTALALVALAAAATGWITMHDGRPTGPFVHRHEQYHFFFGSKYLAEVRYDALYAATSAAREASGRRPPLDRFRDPLTFELVPSGDVPARQQQARDRFSDARWAAFTADLETARTEQHTPFDKALGDHGNTGSPAWAMLARLFTDRLGPDLGGAKVLGALDSLLLIALFGVAWRTFGLRAAAIGLALCMLPSRVGAYLGGSILRLDWLAALGLSLCALQVRRYRTAGALLAWAIASKPITAVFAVSLGARFIASAWRQRRVDRGHLGLVVAALATLAVIVAASSLVFGGPGIWADYVERILVTLHEKFYSAQYSLRDVFLQVRVEGWPALLDPLPDRVAASRHRVRVEDHALAWNAVRFGLAAALLWVVRRRDEVFATAIGALLVYALFVTNLYYWSMFGLVALASARDLRSDPVKALALVIIAGLVTATRVMEAIPSVSGRIGYFGSFWLAFGSLAIIVTEVWRAARTRNPSTGTALRQDP